MTPKEKAKQLVGKMYLIHSKVTFYFAKKGALIAVDEVILEQCKSSELKDPRYQDERLKYWQQVKKEIEKL